MSSQREEEEEEEEDSGSDMMSSPPPPPAGFSDQNKEWLKPAVRKKKTKKKEEDVQPQRNDLLDGSDGESGQELGEANMTMTLCDFKLMPWSMPEMHTLIMTPMLYMQLPVLQCSEYFLLHLLMPPSFSLFTRARRHE